MSLSKSRQLKLLILVTLQMVVVIKEVERRLKKKKCEIAQDLDIPLNQLSMFLKNKDKI